MRSFLDEFAEFLENYGVLGMAIAFVMGLAVKDFVSATVDDLIMPIVEIFLPSGNWREGVWTVLGIDFKVGHFLAAALDFLIIALLIFIFVHHILGKKEIEKI